MVEHAVEHVSDHVLGQGHGTLQIAIRHLRLDHPELGQVPTGLGLFSAERRPKTIDLAQGHSSRFHVELATLSQISRVVEIRGLKQGRSPLTGRRRKNRRIHEDKATRFHEVAAGFANFAADLENGPRTRRPQPQVAVVEEKGHPVFLGCDGVWLSFLHDFEVVDPHLIADGRAHFLPHLTVDYERRFLGQVIAQLK